MARPLSERARAKMLAAAWEIVLDLGLEACTIDAVARHSGVAKSTIYRHFANADELVLASVDTAIEQIESPDTGTLRGDLRAIVVAFRGILDQPGLRHLFASLLARSVADPEFAETYRCVKDSRHVPLRIALQRGIARGEVDPDIDLERAMQFVQGPFVAKRIVDDTELSDDDVEVFLDLITRAVAPAAAGIAAPSTGTPPAA